MKRLPLLAIASALALGTLGCFGDTVSPEGRWVQPTPTNIPSSPSRVTYFMNCTELRTHYGHLIPIPSDHPSYRPELDPDKDGLACEETEATAPVAIKTTATAPNTVRTTANSVYYANCTEMRNAGAAPISRGKPGYRPALDRDNDGLACETD